MQSTEYLSRRPVRRDGRERSEPQETTGNFILNAEDYECSDLKDIRKETTIGFNVVVYPDVSYSQRAI